MPDRVVELFAGVGGFRLGLERSGWRTVWANQWEPSTRVQHAFDCYVERFGPEGAVNADIAAVADDVPAHDLLVAGYPCQDYSVARTLNSAAGIEGKKGVLWWQIHRILRARRPPFVVLENVDRQLRFPAHQRGRDFAIILAALADLGYAVTWRVVNAADHGFPQRRRRVFVVGRRLGAAARRRLDPEGLLGIDGLMAIAFPARVGPVARFAIDGDLVEVSERFGYRAPSTRFGAAGVMVDRQVTTAPTEPSPPAERRVLADVLVADRDVPEGFVDPGRPGRPMAVPEGRET